MPHHHTIVLKIPSVAVFMPLLFPFACAGTGEATILHAFHAVQSATGPANTGSATEHANCHTGENDQNDNKAYKDSHHIATLLSQVLPKG